MSAVRRLQAVPAPAEQTWQLFRWWDAALFTALLEAARTGRRMRVRASRFWPGYWVVEEAGL